MCSVGGGRRRCAAGAASRALVQRKRSRRWHAVEQHQGTDAKAVKAI